MIITLPYGYNRKRYYKVLSIAFSVLLSLYAFKLSSCGSNINNVITSARMYSPMGNPQSSTVVNLKDTIPKPKIYSFGFTPPQFQYIDSVLRNIYSVIGYELSAKQTDQHRSDLSLIINYLETEKIKQDTTKPVKK